MITLKKLTEVATGLVAIATVAGSFAAHAQNNSATTLAHDTGAGTIDTGTPVTPTEHDSKKMHGKRPMKGKSASRSADPAFDVRKTPEPSPESKLETKSDPKSGK